MFGLDGQRFVTQEGVLSPVGGASRGSGHMIHDERQRRKLSHEVKLQLEIFSLNSHLNADTPAVTRGTSLAVIGQPLTRGGAYNEETKSPNHVILNYIPHNIKTIMTNTTNKMRPNQL